MNYKIAETPGKGYGVFSAKTLLPGELIFSDKFLISTEGCEWVPDRKEWENRLATYLQNQVASLADAEKREAFLALRERCHFPQPENRTELGILQEYGLPLGQHAVHYGFFPTACMVNHSCRPNANHVYNPESRQEELRAVTSIAPGEEVTICYVDVACHMKTSAERRAEIRHRFGFTCRCEACGEGDEGQDGAEDGGDEGGLERGKKDSDTLSSPGAAPKNRGTRSLQVEESDRRRLDIRGLMADLPRMKRPTTALAACEALLQLLDEEGFHVAKGPVCRGAVDLALKAGMVQDAISWAERAAEQFSIAFGPGQPSVKDLERLVSQLKESSES